MGIRIKSVSVKKTEQAYITTLNINAERTTTDIEVIDYLSYVVKGKKGRTKVKAQVEVFSCVPIDCLKLKVQSGKSNHCEEITVSCAKYFTKEKSGKIETYCPQMLFSGEYESFLRYHIDEIKYYKPKQFLEIRGWAFINNKRPKFSSASGKGTVWGICEETRQDVVDAFGCDDKVGFFAYMEMEKSAKAVQFCLNDSEFFCKMCIPADVSFGTLTKEEYIEKSELYRRKLPSECDNKYREQEFKGKCLDIIVACNQMCWLDNIVDHIRRLQKYPTIRVVPVITDKNKKEYFEELQKKISQYKNLKHSCIEDIVVICNSQERNAMRFAAWQVSTATHVMFMEQEDVLDTPWLIDVLARSVDGVGAVCTDYDLRHEERFVARVTREQDSWIEENPELILNSCCISRKLFDDCLDYNDIIKQMTERAKSVGDFVYMDLIGYHYSCVQTAWENQIERGKPIAFYLPQYHENEENNKWWGQGFTEWTNVRKAEPLYSGQHQPRIPGELGYYDLVEEQDIFYRQTDLAKQYGVYGFCFYYYWFNGKRLLHKPVNIFCGDKNIDFPYCICWANENWTRRWDGMEHEILMQQIYSEESDIQFIYDVIPMFSDSRYIRVGGKPLLIIYRMNMFPQPAETIQRWREICRKEGVGEIHVSCVQSFDNISAEEYGADSMVEFPPHKVKRMRNIIRNDIAQTCYEEFKGTVFSYKKIVENVSTIWKRDYQLFPGSMVEWDNTARRGSQAEVYAEFDPYLFKIWNIKNQFYSRLYNYNAENIFFINAWNEWAEGSYLEPDDKYGRMMLEIIHEVTKMK